MTTATAQASPNIAFIKYWGNCEDVLRPPMNGSISMNLEGLTTRTTGSFQHSLAFDELIINGHEVTGETLAGGKAPLLNLIERELSRLRAPRA